jgi:hypothetical protein
MRQAVQQSVANVLDPPVRAGTVALAAAYSKVWQYVPQLTSKAEAAVKALAKNNQLPFSFLERYGRAVLSSRIDSPAAVAAGVFRPYSDIDCQFSPGIQVPASVGCLYPGSLCTYFDVSTEDFGEVWRGHATGAAGRSRAPLRRKFIAWAHFA